MWCGDDLKQEIKDQLVHLHDHRTLCLYMYDVIDTMKKIPDHRIVLIIRDMKNL